MDNTPKPRLVILGTGFGAFSLLRKIDTRWYDVTVVSPRNHFLFTPLLPSTTVGTIEFRSITEPVRTAKAGIQFYQASCTALDPQKQLVDCIHILTGHLFSIHYDILTIAVGATINTYGIPGVQEHALFLKELSDARNIRQNIIDTFEKASTPGLDESERRRLLCFVVVGGGPTGVEFAAEMHDFLTEDLQKIFPGLVKDVRITLLEASDHILSSFDEALSKYTSRQFGKQNIDVRTGAMVTKVEDKHVYLKDGTAIPYGVLVWSTGLGPLQFVRDTSLAKDANSRIVTDEYLRTDGYTNIYAIGDCAGIRQKQLPSTAQVAQQEGEYIGKQLNNLAQSKSLTPFRYKHFGMLAYIGGNRALADLSSFKGRGFTAWLFWRSAYLTKLVSFKNKVLVIFDWLKTIIFGRDISRF